MSWCAALEWSVTYRHCRLRVAQALGLVQVGSALCRPAFHLGDQGPVEDGAAVERQREVKERQWERQREVKERQRKGSGRSMNGSEMQWKAGVDESSDRVANWQAERPSGRVQGAETAGRGGGEDLLTRASEDAGSNLSACSDRHAAVGTAMQWCIHQERPVQGVDRWTSVLAPCRSPVGPLGAARAQLMMRPAGTVSQRRN